MRVENLQTAHEHKEYTQCVHPMQHASRKSMSADDFGLRHHLWITRYDKLRVYSVNRPGTKPARRHVIMQAP